MEAAIKHDLELIKMIAGPMRFEPKAMKLYEEWYAEEDRKIDMGMPAIRDPRFSGYVSRRATHIKKIAMTLVMLSCTMPYSLRSGNTPKCMVNQNMKAKVVAKTPNTVVNALLGMFGLFLLTIIVSYLLMKCLSPQPIFQDCADSFIAKVRCLRSTIGLPYKVV